MMKRFFLKALVLMLCLSTLSVCAFASADANYVAEVDGTKYTDINSAWDAVKDGGSISMLADWKLATALVVPEDKTMTLNMNGHMINRDTLGFLKKDGQAIKVEDSANLTINGGNKSVVHKGGTQNGIWVIASRLMSTGTQYNISGGLITGGGNRDAGGGLSIGEDAKVTLVDVTIAGNRCEKYGAGVYMEDGNELVMERSHIIYNYANTDGGGIFMDENNCSVTGDNISSISNNTAVNWGGGIYADGVSDGKITKVLIQNNHANKGGGVLVDNDSSVLLKDITITNNTADETGAGVFCEAYGLSAAHIILDGRVIIKDNFKGNGQNNIMLENARAMSASYSEVALTEDSEVGFGAYINKIRLVVTWEAQAAGMYSGSRVFMDHDAGWAFAIAQARSMQIHRTYKEKSYKNVTVKFLEDWNAVDGDFDPNADDGFSDGAIYVPENVTITLDMNGHTIHRHKEYDGWNNEVILVNGTLYLSNGRIVGGYSNNGGGGIHIDGGKAILNNVEVTGNRTLDDNGAGIHVVDGTLEATDCNIHRNKAWEDDDEARGGGIYASNSTVNLTRTAVRYNETMVSVTSTFNLIKYCEGGGIYAEDSKLTLTDCKVRDNYAYTAGNDIYAKNATIDIIGGEYNRDLIRSVNSTITFVSDESGQPEVIGSVFGSGSVIAIIVAAVVIAAGVVIAVIVKKKNKNKNKTK